MSLRGKVALIIGGGKSPDAEISRELAKEDAELALHYTCQRSREQTLHFRDQLQDAYPGVKISIHGGDVSTAPAIDKLFGDVIAEHDKIDLVVNTAGMILRKPTAGVSGVEYDRMLAYAVFVDDQRRKCTDRYIESIQGLRYGS